MEHPPGVQSIACFEAIKMKQNSQMSSDEMLMFHCNEILICNYGVELGYKIGHVIQHTILRQKMVALMGAQLLKPLIASEATHLICQKSEGAFLYPTKESDLEGFVFVYSSKKKRRINCVLV